MAESSEADVLIRRIVEQRLTAMISQLDRNTAVPISWPGQIYRRSEETGEYELVHDDLRDDPPALRAQRERQVVEDNRLDEIQHEMKWAVERALKRILPKYPGVKRSELLGAVLRSFAPGTGGNAEPIFDRDLVREAHAALMRDAGMDARSADAELARALDVSARTIQTYRLTAPD